jgi:ABC-type Fe3+/spermidine/putrescine transport system ATPase subunit
MLNLIDINRNLGEFALKDISIDIPEGQYYVLLGRSGAGKTQLLELIAGLEKPDSGSIILDGENITFKKIQERKIGIVFQDYAVFPHMTVFGNIAYPLKSHKGDEEHITSKVAEAARQMNIFHLLDRMPEKLSGGELQRIALARTLITSPRLLLLDEPLSSLDASLKDDMKALLRKLNKSGQTIIHVTHDYSDAVSLASRVGVIHNGRIIQEGSVDEVFRKPANRFVARYAGIRNFFRITVTERNGTTIGVTKNNLELKLDANVNQEDCLAIIKNDDIDLSVIKPEGESLNIFRCRVEEIIPYESGMEVTLDAGDRLFANVAKAEFEKMTIKEHDEVWVSFPVSSLKIISCQSD